MYNTDGANLWTALNGTLFGFWGIDTNDQMIRLAITLYYDTEYYNTWTRFMIFVKNIIKEIYDSRTYIISDVDKSFKISDYHNYKGERNFMFRAQ